MLNVVCFPDIEREFILSFFYQKQQTVFYHKPFTYGVVRCYEFCEVIGEMSMKSFENTKSHTICDSLFYWKPVEILQTSTADPA